MTHAPQTSTGEEIVRYEWHPAVRAIGWLLGWVAVAECGGVVWEFVATGEVHQDRVLARAAWIFAALPFLAVAAYLVDLAGSIAQHAWVNYRPEFARKIYTIAFIAFAAVATPYIWFTAWLLEQIRPSIFAWFAVHAAGAPSNPVPPEVTWKSWCGWCAATALLAWLLYKQARSHPFYEFRSALRVLGPRKLAVGILLMSYLRCLGPRRDFFLQAPVVAWALPLAIIILIHEWVRVPILEWVVPALLLTLLLPYEVGFFAPPLWLYLGTTGAVSMSTFHLLRQSWRCHGINLFDRGDPGSVAVYNAWRATRPVPAPMDPTIGRVWSLRTRPRLWQTVVRLLTAFVPVVVLDGRGDSAPVQSERNWLVQRGYANKTYVIVPAGTSYSDARFTNVLEDEMLDEGAWTPAVLNVRGAPPAGPA